MADLATLVREMRHMADQYRESGDRDAAGDFEDFAARLASYGEGEREMSAEARAAYCTYCGEVSARYEGDGEPDEAAIEAAWQAANAHDQVCPQNPIVARLTSATLWAQRLELFVGGEYDPNALGALVNGLCAALRSPGTTEDRTP